MAGFVLVIANWLFSTKALIFVAHLLSHVAELGAIRINVVKVSLTSLLFGMPDNLLGMLTSIGSFVCDLSIFALLYPFCFLSLL